MGIQIHHKLKHENRNTAQIETGIQIQHILKYNNRNTTQTELQ